MNHSFDIEIATEYGVNCAIILNNLYFWIEKNEANEKNFFDGNYWTYNSVKAFSKQFPYMSDKQIRTALKTLEAEGLVITGNYNANKYDRTKWYALTEKAKTVLQKVEMDFDKRANGNLPKGEPIPDTVPDKKPDYKDKESKSNLDDRFSEFWSVYPKKKSKATALKAWKKLNPDKDLADRIIKAVGRQKHWDEWKAENGKYIPYPATWLNAGGWEDERQRTEMDDYMAGIMK